MPAAGLLLPVLTAALLAHTALAGGCPNTLKTPYAAPVPGRGWTTRVVANEGLSKPRSLLFDTSGALLVLDSAVGVKRLVLEDHGGTCVTVKETTTVIDNGDVSASSRV